MGTLEPVHRVLTADSTVPQSLPLCFQLSKGDEIDIYDVLQGWHWGREHCLHLEVTICTAFLWLTRLQMGKLSLL